MKSLAATALIIAAPALAQTAPRPAATATPTPAGTATTAAARFSLDTPIEQLVADPRAKQVLIADLGNDPSQHPMYEQFKSLSLNQVQPMAQGAITDDQMKKIAADLAALK